MATMTLPVTSLLMGAERMDRHEVGKLIGVSGDTISAYVRASKAGGRYEDHPFPPALGEPFDGRPAWKPEQADAIRAWAAARPGQGVGGGKPAHRDFH